ncbi:MAG: tripartite tricarboxylate transporter substrate binding protein [Burkholderiales bacterium]|nr:tripartite tricarboxylate transporter substrate binding protein [Burkholderiales bacterium]
MDRRLFLAALAASPLLSSPASAQNWPAKPIRLIVPFTPGGTVDILSRLLGQQMSKILKQPVVVENRPGAGGNVGMEVVARAPADGYTLVMGSIGTCSMNPYLYDKIGFDVDRDFVPVMLVGSVANLLVVHPSVPATSVKELVALAKARPDSITFASSGFGSSLHIAGELFQSVAGIELRHVPYKGSAPAVTELVGGQVNMMFDNMPSIAQHALAGRARPLAVTSVKRSKLFPDVPTMQEAGYPGFIVAPWFGVLAPAKTPEGVLTKLNAALNQGLRDATVQKRLAQIDLEPAGGSGADYGRLIKSESERWSKLIREKNIRPE